MNGVVHMSAVPQKKLCWNCEGNVSREIDNCPYCGVYLHAAETEEETSWNPSYSPPSTTEEIPSPLYHLQPNEPETSEESPSDQASLANTLKQDIFPLLFLMAGSIFFIFGIVLWLFAQDGTLTLQWQGHHSVYFLFLAFPLLILGWKFLRNAE